MFKSGDGEQEKDRKTIVKITYDDSAIYFGATMYDPHKINSNTIYITR